MTENKTKVATKAPEKDSFTWGNGESESEMTATAMPPMFGLAASPAQPNPGDKKSFNEDEEFDDRGIKVKGVPPAAVAEIIKFEALKYVVYNDSVGIPTAGIGHKLTAGENKKLKVGDKVTREQIEGWAQHDLAKAWNAAQSQCATLGITQNAFAVALLSVNFQLGTAWNKEHVKTWSYMLEGEWENAAQEAARSSWYKQTKNRVIAFQGALRNLPLKGAANTNDTQHSEGMLERFNRVKNEGLEVQAAKPEGMVDRFNRIKNEKLSAQNSKPASSKVSKNDKQALGGKERVKVIQSKLQALGLYKGTIDGIEFRRDKKESNTTKGIKAFQKSKGLPVTGKADQATWDALSGKATEPKGFAEAFREKVAEAKAAARESEGKGWGSDREKEADGDKKQVAASGDTIAPILGAAEFYSQLHPSKGTDRSIPREIAFSGVLAKYDHGGSADIYDNTKCKKAWRSLSIQAREIKVYNYACKNTCSFVLSNAGYSASGPGKSVWSLLEEKGSSMAVSDTVDESRNRLDEYLENGIPVLIGMDYKPKGPNAGSATDHFVIAVGRGNDEKGKFYQYMDVGRTKTSAGTNYDANRLYVGRDKSDKEDADWTSGKKPNSSSFYSLSEVREMSKK